jgi:hypothetical protein
MIHLCENKFIFYDSKNDRDKSLPLISFIERIILNKVQVYDNRKFDFCDSVQF